MPRVFGQLQLAVSAFVPHFSFRQTPQNPKTPATKNLFLIYEGQYRAEVVFANGLHTLNLRKSLTSMNSMYRLSFIVLRLYICFAFATSSSFLKKTNPFPVRLPVCASSNTTSLSATSKPWKKAATSFASILKGRPLKTAILDSFSLVINLRSWTAELLWLSNVCNLPTVRNSPRTDTF